MKFTFITDVHIGNYRPEKSIYRKVTPLAPKLLEQFVQKMNNEFHPDFVVQGGDLIEDTKRDVDIKNIKMGLAILSKLRCPVYNLVGNHEMRCLTMLDLKKLFRFKNRYFSFDKKGVRFIFLFTEQPYPGKQIWLSVQQMLWLKKQVQTKLKIIIFSHHSLVPVDTKGNFWFEGRPEVTYINNFKEFQQTISKKNVKLCFNGHLHWNRKKSVKSIPFVTVQSLVENTSGNVEGPPSNSYALVNLKDNIASILIKGSGGRKYRIKL